MPIIANARIHRQVLNNTIRMSWQLVSAVRLRGYSNLGVPQEPLGGLLESRVQISAVMIFRVAGLSSRIYPHAGPLRCNRECVQAVWKKTKLWLCARGPRRCGDGENSRLAGAPPGCPVLSHVYLRIWNPVLLLHRKSSWAPSLWAPAMRRGRGDYLLLRVSPLCVCGKEDVLARASGKGLVISQCGHGPELWGADVGLYASLQKSCRRWRRF